MDSVAVAVSLSVSERFVGSRGGGGERDSQLAAYGGEGEGEREQPHQPYTHQPYTHQPYTHAKLSNSAHAHTQSFVHRNFTGLGDSPMVSDATSASSSTDTNLDLSDRSDGGDSQGGGSRPTSGENAADGGGGHLRRANTSIFAEYRLTVESGALTTEQRTP